MNNAGLGRNNSDLWDGSTASWVEMVSTNVLGVCMCTREAIQVKGSLPTILQGSVCARVNARFNIGCATGGRINNITTHGQETSASTDITG